MQQQIAVKGRSAVRRSALVPRSAGHHRPAHLCNKAPQTTVHFNVDQNASRAAELLYKQHNVRCHQPGTPTGPLAETCKAIRALYGLLLASPDFTGASAPSAIPETCQHLFLERVSGRHWNSGLPLWKKHRFCSQGKSQPVFRAIWERQLK